MVIPVLPIVLLSDLSLQLIFVIVRFYHIRPWFR